MQTETQKSSYRKLLRFFEKYFSCLRYWLVLKVQEYQRKSAVKGIKPKRSLTYFYWRKFSYSCHKGRFEKKLIIWTCAKFFKLQLLIKFNFTDLISNPEIIWKVCSLHTPLLIKRPWLLFSYVLLEEILVYWFVWRRSGPWESGVYIILDEWFIFIKFCLGLFIGKESHTRLTSLHMKPTFS